MYVKTVDVLISTSSVASSGDRKRAEPIAIVKGYIMKPMDDKNIDNLIQLFENETDQ